MLQNALMTDSLHNTLRVLLKEIDFGCLWFENGDIFI